MIAIIDYGMGNLRSVQKAVEKCGITALVTSDVQDIKRAMKIVLPGVGAMQPAMERLSELGLIPAIEHAVSEGKPFLGICLGLQLLFETSSEGGRTQGLALVKGTVERFTQLKVPHMGWNQIQFSEGSSPLWKGIDDEANVYFCHSYYVKPADKSVTSSITDYGVRFSSSVCQKNIYGVQFHPEKSQKVGLKMLENFIKL